MVGCAMVGCATPRVLPRVARPGWIGMVGEYALTRDARVLSFVGSNEHGQLGLRSPEDRVGRVELPEPAAEVFPTLFGESWWVRGRSGAVYVPDGYADEPGVASVRRVPLPGPAIDGIDTRFGYCVSVEHRGVYCWGADRTARRLPGSPDVVRDLSRGLLGIVEAGELLGWFDDGPDARPVRITDGVHRLAVGTNYVCVIRGPDRALHCWGPHRHPSDGRRCRIRSRGG
ncbi:MAG: hypothetical protein AB7S26_43050 [Sandaracinaceae bacterium]